MYKNLIETVAKTVSDTGGYFACWSKVTYPSDEGHRYTRADKVYLNLLYTPPSTDQPVFRRLSCCRVHPERGPVQVYALEQTYRITSGPRKGCVVSSRDIEGHEHIQPAGISKILEYRPSPSTFYSSHQGDAIVFALLRRFESYETRTTLLSHLPILYHTYRWDQAGDLRLRPTGEAVRWVEGHSNRILHDNYMQASDALISIQGSLSRNAGNGRLALPYDKVYGRGVVVATESPGFSFDQWVHVPDIYTKTSCLEVCHELKDVFCNEERS